MFHTLTLNPSLDHLMTADSFAPGGLNRARDARLFAGGKGVNVALMLRRLGVPARALGFLAGGTGQLLQSMLAAEGLETEFVFLSAGMTRINLKLETLSAETELNGPGPAPDAAALAALENQLAAIPAGDTLVAAGGLPPGPAPDIYARLLAPCAARGVRCVLDASGEALRAGLGARPWLIKPNWSELAGLLGLPEKEYAAALAGGRGPNEAKDTNTLAGNRPAADGKGPDAAGRQTQPLLPALQGAMRTAQGLGARNVLVSLGGQGAALLAETGELFFQAAPAGRPVNTAGAGDSLLAGFLAGLARGYDPAAALRLGVAAGSATAFCPWLAGAEQIEALLAGFSPA